MKRAVLLMSVMSIVACDNVTVLREPETPAHFAVIESGARGGEVQAADPLEAEAYMWRRCPKGFTVARREDVAVGATSTSKTWRSRGPIANLGGPSETTETTTSPVNEERTVFECVPAQKSGPANSVANSTEATEASSAAAALP